MSNSTERYVVKQRSQGFYVLDTVAHLFVVGPMALRESADRAAEKRNRSVAFKREFGLKGQVK